MKTPAPDAAASSNPARKRTKTRPAARRRTDENTYTDPDLRERLKSSIRAAAKGGEPGTWSARKSQLLTLAYQKSGGGYLQHHPNSKQKKLAGGGAQNGASGTRKLGGRAAGATRPLATSATWPASPPEKKTAAKTVQDPGTAVTKRARKPAE